MATAGDGLKWFGEGFDGFPRGLPDNCVEYVLYIIDEKSQTDSELRGRLGQALNTANDLALKLLKNYIWQREPFELELRNDDDHGDSVEDEWVIVFLLREISKIHQDLWIRVSDSDGEFLLIEAAKVLPSWLNPEIADNRVWINGGSLKIIPLDSKTRKTAKDLPSEASLSLKEARSFIARNRDGLLSSPSIEDEAFYRLRNYPDQIQGNLHRALVRIPRNLAVVLHAQPQVVSQAVEAFYLRDPIALQPLRSATANEHSGLVFPPLDLVTMSTTFSKVGYAQLKSQEFAIPAWEPVLSKEKDTKEYAQAEMGMKLSCGFEMLVTDHQNQDRNSVKTIRQLLNSVRDGQGNLPTSEEISGWGLVEDDESWLDIDFEEFNQELSGRSKGKGKDGASPLGAGFGDKAAQENLRKMVERFAGFLDNDTAGPAGAEFHDIMDDDDDDDDDNYSDISSDGEDKDISFDETEFARVMREMMGMPPEEVPATSSGPAPEKSRFQELDSDDDDDDDDPGSERDEEDEDADDDQMQDIMRRMEAELKEKGFLDPVPQSGTSSSHNTLKENVPGSDQKQATRETGDESKDRAGSDDDDSEQGGELDIDYNLAKNMLESFKGQAGLAGPGGNLLGLMGMHFPRDEDDRLERNSK
ncbi:MAG: hypothetical protein M4579_003371 [Chaenotheca gracillima]|nr:MAG: hypothetical protein M4579_003371 [Chaenotheca gracillima]